MIHLDEYLDEPEKYSRTRNLLETQEDSLTYFAGWGVDKAILAGEYPIQSRSIQSYFRQKAFQHGIILTGSEMETVDFTQTTLLPFGKLQKYNLRKD